MSLNILKWKGRKSQKKSRDIKGKKDTLEQEKHSI